MRRAVAVVVAAGALACLGGCGSSTGGSSGGGGGEAGAPPADCIILANGGNKLCGEDAATWCRSTDSLRQGSTVPALMEAQQNCLKIEGDYP